MLQVMGYVNGAVYAYKTALSRQHTLFLTVRFLDGLCLNHQRRRIIRVKFNKVNVDAWLGRPETNGGPELDSLSFGPCRVPMPQHHTVGFGRYNRQARQRKYPNQQYAPKIDGIIRRIIQYDEHWDAKHERLHLRSSRV